MVYTLPENAKHTNELILRLTRDYIRSIRSRRLLSIVLICVGIIIVIVGILLPGENFESISKLITSATGLTVSASSLFPINDVIKYSLKIRTLESLAADLTNDTDATDEETKRIEALVWKLVEQTVIA